eukprot:4923443-Pyramimonas_sp.AAC.1
MGSEISHARWSSPHSPEIFSRFLVPRCRARGGGLARFVGDILAIMGSEREDEGGSGPNDPCDHISVIVEGARTHHHVLAIAVITPLT